MQHFRQLTRRLTKLEQAHGYDAGAFQREVENLCDAHLLAIVQGFEQGIVYDNIGSPALRQQLRAIIAQRSFPSK